MYTSNDSLIHHVCHHLRRPWRTRTGYERAFFRGGLTVSLDDDYHPTFSLSDRVVGGDVRRESAEYQEMMEEMSFHSVEKLQSLIDSSTSGLTPSGTKPTRRELLEVLHAGCVDAYGKGFFLSVFYKALLDSDFAAERSSATIVTRFLHGEEE